MYRHLLSSNQREITLMNASAVTKWNWSGERKGGLARVPPRAKREGGYPCRNPLFAFAHS
jgi:hypothetical protein